MNLETATPAQREAITTERTDVLAVAGPGSGKTATLVARIKNLRENGAKPEQIACITFTNAGANEIANRLDALYAHKDDPKVESGFGGTLHSFALRMLKEHGAEFGYGDRISIISPESAADLLASKAKSLGCKAPMKDLLALKAKGRPARTGRLDLSATVVASFLDDLKEAGVVDYDVLLQEFLRALTEDGPASLGFNQAIANRFSYLFVDEVQDSAPIDWEIYRALQIAFKFYVGDPDQAIYGFRGGRVREMIAHGRDSSVLVVKLEDNFRSRAEICAGAQSLIERNRDRLEKSTRSVSGDGGKVVVLPPCANAGEEIGVVVRRIKELLADHTPWPDLENPITVPDRAPLSIAILARTNAIAEGFRKTLPSCSIPVVETKRSDLPRDWPMARAFVELLSNPDNDALAFFYLIALYEKKGASPSDARAAAHAARRSATSVGKSLNRASIGIGRITRPDFAIAALSDSGVSREAQAIAAEKFRELPPGASVLDLSLALGEVREYSKEEDGDGVRVLTIHGAKGREFDVVFCVGFEDETLPGRAAKLGEEAIEEERRLAYVAITRARSTLYLSSCESRVTPWGEVVKRTPSRFIAEIVHPRHPAMATE